MAVTVYDFNDRKYASVYLDCLRMAIHRYNLVVSQGRSAKSYCTRQRSRPVHLHTHAHATDIFFLFRCTRYIVRLCDMNVCSTCSRVSML